VVSSDSCCSLLRQRPPLLLFSRVLVGFGEGVAPPAATDLVARLMPASERTRAVAAVFNGFNVGSILGLLAAPILIENYGWESVFYFSGLRGCCGASALTPTQSPGKGYPQKAVPPQAHRWHTQAPVPLLLPGAAVCPQAASPVTVKQSQRSVRVRPPLVHRPPRAVGGVWQG